MPKKPMATNLIRIASPEDVAPGRGVAAEFRGTPVALFNLDGRIVAIGDSCLRCGSSLAAGATRGTTVTCSGCGWRYDVLTGCVDGLPELRIDTFDVKVEHSDVMVDAGSPWPPPK